jgi:sugar lactone lactonase YvrE
MKLIRNHLQLSALLLALLWPLLQCPAQVALQSSKTDSRLSDINRDGVVDMEDLKQFSQLILRQDWQTVDWRGWVDENQEWEGHFRELFSFIRRTFQISVAPPYEPLKPPPPQTGTLAIVNQNNYPTRLAWGPGGSLYVTDAFTQSLFIYNPELFPVGELKGLASPLGVVVDSQGRIYVGNNGRDNVEVYAPTGNRIGTVGEGLIRMPNDLTLDGQNQLYVADSKNDKVWVFAEDGQSRVIGEGQLKFPSAVTIRNPADPPNAELFVADQGNYLIKVFDLEGNLLRSFGGRAKKKGYFGNDLEWQGLFGRVQGLAFDAAGHLHALDCYLNRVQILNPQSGEFINVYGIEDTARLRVPLGLAIEPSGLIVVANSENRRLVWFLEAQP